MFEPEHREGCKTDCEVDAPLESATDEQTTQDNQDNVPQVGKRPYHLGIVKLRKLQLEMDIISTQWKLRLTLTLLKR